MKYKIILLYPIFFIFLSCTSRTEKQNVKHEKSAFRIDLQKLTCSDSTTIVRAMEELKKQYNFIADTSEVNVLYVKNRHDSVFFDFAIFDKKYLNLLFNTGKNVKERGFIVCSGYRLLVFDEIGLFEKKDTYQRIDFGKQRVEDLLFYEPLKYRYYLEKNKKLTFIEESWF